MTSTDLQEQEREGADTLDDMASQFSPKEQAAFGDLAANDPKGDDDQKDSLYNPDDEEPKKKGRLTRNQKILGGVTAALVSGSLGIFTIISPLAKFAQIPAFFKLFHSSEKESFFEDRLYKGIRYAKFPGANNRQYRRLGPLGNFMSNTLDNKFARAGIDPVVENGRWKALRFDPTVFSPDDLKAIQKDFGEGTKVGKGIVEIEIDSQIRTAGKEKRLLRTMRKSLGITGTRASLQGNRYGKFLGITRHPIKKLDRLALESADAYRARVRKAWDTRKKQLIRSGERIRTSGSVKPDDGNPNTSEETDSQRASAELEDVANSSPDLDGNAKVAATKAKLRAAGSVTLVVGTTCLIKGLADNAADYEDKGVVAKSMFVGGYQGALGEQAKANIDIDTTQLGYEDEHMYDESNDDNPQTRPSSFFDADTIRQELGLPLLNFPTPLSATIGGNRNVFSQMVSHIPGLGGVCGVATSFVGQVVSFGLDVATGPVSAVVGLAASFAAAPYIDDVARIIANENIPRDMAGSTLGAVSNQGWFFKENQEFITMGATALSNTERAQLKQTVRGDTQLFANDNSWSERYLSTTNPNSLAARAYMSYGGRAPNLSRIVASPGAIISSLSSVFSAKVSAQASTVDYGAPKFAFRQSEVDTLNTNESFTNLYQNVAIIDAQVPQLHKEYAKDCFGLEFDSEDKFQVVDSVNTLKYPDKCRSNNETLLRYRTYIADLMVMTTAACDAGLEEACAQLGYGDSGTPAGNLQQPSGDVQNLAKQLLENPKVTYWTNNGVNTRDVVVALSEGKPAYTTCANAANKTTEVNPKILQFLVEAGQQTNIMVNALTDKCHRSSNSRHYSGEAVDLDLGSGPLSIINPVAAKYGGTKNSETDHHHFDFPRAP